MWSHGAFGFMWPMRTLFESWASVTMRNAERHTPSSGISVTLNAAVAGDLLKRENRRSVVMAPAGRYARRALMTLRLRRVIRLVVRFRRQAFPRADRPNDLRLQVARHGLEAAVLRRPERAALGRGTNRGCEAEHLRDGRLRVDDRDLAFLRDVLDHAAAALDVPDRGPHVVLRDVDEHFLDWLHEASPTLDHRAVDRRPRGGDDLRGTSVDRVFVELRVHEEDLHRHALLPGERPFRHRLDVRFLDQLHRLVEVLNPLRRVDQHVRVLHPHDVLRLVPVHPELLELLGEHLRILDPLSRRDLAAPDCLDDLLLERLDLHVEPVVLVRRLAFERAPFAADALAVDDDRRAGRDRDLVVVLDAVARDLEVELTHPGDQVLARLLVDLDLDARVCLREEPQRLDELRQVRRRLRLHRDRHDGVGVVDDLLEGLHLLVVADRRSRDRVFESDDRDDVARVDFVDGDAVRADDHRDGLGALRLRHADDPELLAASDLAREQTACGDLARLGVDDDLRHHERDRPVLVDREHRLAHGR